MENKKKNFWIIMAVIPAILIVFLIAGFLGNKKNDETKLLDAAQVTSQNQGITVSQKMKEKVLKTETEFSVKIIEDGLKDMGFLVTETYYFKEVTTGEKFVKFFGAKAPFDFGKSSFLISYEGDVTAGIHFDQIEINKDEDNMRILVTLPKSEIFKVTIDPESYQKIDEKTSLWTEFNIDDFNESLKELHKEAEKNAIDRGLLKSADENAENVVRGFIKGFVDTQDYKIEFVR